MLEQQKMRIVRMILVIRIFSFEKHSKTHKKHKKQQNLHSARPPDKETAAFPPYFASGFCGSARRRGPDSTYN